MNLSLGGPGVACSATRVRRLLAGELEGGELERVRQHLSACARCQEVEREVAREGEALSQALPFEAFAAGVAERVARQAPAPRRRAWPMALAAGLALAAAVPLVARLAGQGGRDDPYRAKGGPSLALYLQEAGGARALASGEAVPAGARLRPALQPGNWRQAALVLVDGDGAVTLWAGPARPGPIPEAFEWTGKSAQGTLVLVLSDEPVDARRLEARLAGGAAATSEPVPGGRAEMVLLPLRRAGTR